MPAFTYIARTAQGTIDRGVIKASTIDDARERLRKQGAFVEEIQSEEYVPLLDTLRLFAGWLLGWYGLIYLLGALQLKRILPEDLPLVQSLFTSGIILRLTFATFLFLLLSSLHRALYKGAGVGALLTAIGMALFFLVHINI